MFDQLITAGAASKTAAASAAKAPAKSVAKKAPAKAAAKPAKAPATKKAAATPSAKGKATAKAPANPFRYRIVTGRPSSGGALQAFTAAWLEMSGLTAGKAIDKKTLAYVAGDTAIAHHVKAGRFALVDGKVSLTAGGKLHFAAREVNKEEQKGWAAILRTGKADGALIKNQDCISAIPA